jgi:hypothetical protein
VGLSGTLYLPAGYDKVKRKFLLIWAYPTEYKDKNSAGQIKPEFTFLIMDHSSIGLLKDMRC